MDRLQNEGCTCPVTACDGFACTLQLQLLCIHLTPVKESREANAGDHRHKDDGGQERREAMLAAAARSWSKLFRQPVRKSLKMALKNLGLGTTVGKACSASEPGRERNRPVAQPCDGIE